MLGALSRASEPNHIYMCVPLQTDRNLCAKCSNDYDHDVYAENCAAFPAVYHIFVFFFRERIPCLLNRSIIIINVQQKNMNRYLCFALSYTMCSSLITGEIIIARRKKKLLLFSIAEAIKIA